MSFYGASDSADQCFLNEIDNTLLLGENEENHENELYKHFDNLRVHNFNQAGDIISFQAEHVFSANI